MAPTFSQYFKPADHSEFPKYILYSGLDVNIDALVRVLGGVKYAYMSADPGASISIEFSTLECCGLSVRILFNNNPRTSASGEEIYLADVTRTDNGSVQASAFKKWIEEMIVQMDDEVLTGLTLEEKCNESLSYDQNDYENYYDTYYDELKDKWK